MIPGRYPLDTRWVSQGKGKKKQEVFEKLNAHEGGHYADDDSF
jgi:hypothetical protein